MDIQLEFFFHPSLQSINMNLCFQMFNKLIKKERIFWVHVSFSNEIHSYLSDHNSGTFYFIDTEEWRKQHENDYSGILVDKLVVS